MEHFDILRHDVRLVLRTFTRNKAWTAVAILTLALGVGANSALFTIINAVMLRPLPYPFPDRIMSISETEKGIDNYVPSPAIVEWRRSARSFASVAARTGTSTIMSGHDVVESVTGARVTANYFATLGLVPARGRTFTAEEDVKGGPSVVVLSEQLWRRLFGADPSIVGTEVRLDAKPFAVIGVMPAAFTASHGAQYWIPLAMATTPGVTFFYDVIGRLRSGASVESARSELTRIQRSMDLPVGMDFRAMTPTVMTLHVRRYGDTRTPLLVLLGAVGVLLLIACTNVANLLLARAAQRQKEFAVRVALGASQWRLVRYLLTESILLSLAGGAIGLLIPVLATDYVLRIGPRALAQADGVAVDWVVVAFTLGVCVVTGMVFGLAPAINAARTDVSVALASAGTRTTSSRGHRRFRDALVVAELATALVLLTAAGTLTKSFLRVMSVDTGIRPDRLLSVSFSLSRTKYAEGAGPRFIEPLRQRIRALPGVRSVALADASPLGGVRMSLLDNDLAGHEKGVRIDVSVVDNDYFATLGIASRSGRLFGDEDRRGAPPVAVVNEAFVRAKFPNSDPLGQETRCGMETKCRIIGVVHDVLQRGIELAAAPMLYTPLAQGETDAGMIMFVKVAGDPASVMAPIRDAARTIDATQPPPKIMTMEDTMLEAVAPRRFSFVLLGLLASLAALLAAIGLYGVMSYLVTERTSEIGVRVALGADRGRVLAMVLGQGSRLAVSGIVIGLGASVLAARALRGMVYQISVYDPWTFSATAALLATIAFVACCVPAWRATRVDPMVALRGE